MTLCEWREREGLTQHEVAERLGAAQSYVCQLETGTRRPSVDVAARIVAMTGGEVTLEEAFGLPVRKAS